jgi:putative transposase
LQQDSYFPGWLLEPRPWAERAMVAVVAECHFRCVSTRRVQGLVAQLRIESMSNSQLSELAKSLDAGPFRPRPLDAAPCTHVALDALTEKVRKAGRIVNVAVVIATGVNADGHREILGPGCNQDGAR